MVQSLLTTLPFIVCGILVAELALDVRQRPNRPQTWLLVWAATAMVLYGCHFLFFHHETRWIAFTDCIYTVCNLAVYPLYLVYISELADQQPLSRQPLKLLLWLSPAVVAGIVLALMYAMMAPDELRQYAETNLYHGSQGGLRGLTLAVAQAHTVCHVLFAVTVVAVLVHSVRRIRRYNHNIEQFYADTDDKSMKPIDLALKLIIVTSLLSVVANYIGRHWFVDSPWLALPSLAFAILLFAIGQSGRRLRPAMSELMVETTESPKQRKAVATEPSTDYPDTLKELHLRLEQLMRDEQVFLQHDLRLDQVALRLGTNRTYLLQTLRNETGMTFKEFVNRLRISYAEDLMRREPDLPKTEVAAQSGYSTPSSFYRNLKAYGSQPT